MLKKDMATNLKSTSITKKILEAHKKQTKTTQQKTSIKSQNIVTPRPMNVQKTNKAYVSINEKSSFDNIQKYQIKVIRWQVRRIFILII